MHKSADIAVVGMSCIFPGAKNLSVYWQNILDKKCSIEVAPEHRVAESYYDPSSPAYDRHCVRHGGFIDRFLEFNPLEFGMVPNALKGVEPDQLLALQLAKEALDDAGMFEKDISLEGAGIIIGKGNFAGVETVKLGSIVEGARDFERLLKVLFPDLESAEIQRVKKRYQEQFGNPNPSNVMGTVPNLVASLIANRFNFGGPAYTLDSACASSLLGIDHAVRELQLGRCDTVVVGAVHLAQSASMFSFFETLGALSKQAQVRPFDQAADGVLTGEGAGFVVLRRIEDAVKSSQRVYSVIKGVGVSSDGNTASVMSPSSIGQSKAIHRAWDQSGLEHSQIGYIEAHGTGTVLGDQTELETLSLLFPQQDDNNIAGIGAVKALIGHAMAAAGMAGFIKTNLAVYHGIVPPTANCENPIDALSKTRFQTVDKARAWGESNRPRVAGVNAFGFGGTNTHVVLQQFLSDDAGSKDGVVLLARSNVDLLCDALDSGDYSVGSGRCRLAIFNPTKKRIAMAKRIIAKGGDWRGRQGIWFTKEPLLFDENAKIAFLFPGLDVPAIEAVNKKDIDSLIQEYELVDATRKIAADKPLSHAEAVQEGQMLNFQALSKIQITPDLVAGHSLGEWTACRCIGLWRGSDLAKVNEIIASKNYEPISAIFLSVNCSLEEISPFLDDQQEVYLCSDNCFQQVVVAVGSQDAQDYRSRLLKAGISSHELPFSTGYHTPFAKIYVPDAEFYQDEVMNFRVTKTPIWSSITASPYPSEIEKIKQLHLDFIVQPVKFRSLIENMYADGVRVFVQVGDGALTGFVSNILPDKTSLIIATGCHRIGSVAQLQRVAAALFVEGRIVDLSKLNVVQSAAKDRPDDNSDKTDSLTTMIDLRFPYSDYEHVFDSQFRNAVMAVSQTSLVASPDAASPTCNASAADAGIVQSLERNMLEFNQLQRSLQSIVSSNNEAYAERFEVGVDINREFEFSIEKFPYLMDHCPFEKRSINDDFSKELKPIVPFTFYIDILVQWYLEHFPTFPIASLTNAHVESFLWVSEAKSVTLRGEWQDQNSIKLSVDGFFEVVAHVGQSKPNTFSPMPTVGLTKDVPIFAEEIYTQNYMFHGPSYQGVQRIGAFTEHSLETTIKGVSVEGAMLDNIGQTVGLFYHFSGKCLRSYPVGIGEIKFFQSATDRSGEFICRCFYDREDSDYYYANVEVYREGQIWCQIVGWKTKKLDLDSRAWALLNRAEGNTLSNRFKGDVFVVESAKYKHTNSWFTLANIYLCEREMDAYQRLSVARQREHLLGRIAAKDALREALMHERGILAHPASLTVFNNVEGRPEVDYAGKLLEEGQTLNVSISHKNGIAIAKASFDKAIGVDIEQIKARSDGFLELLIGRAERKLLGNRINSDDWITRVWVAKEAYGKMIGKGLQGSPKRYSITAVNGEDLSVEGVVVRTTTFKNNIVGWTI